MCLITKTKDMVKSDSAITCYKIVKKVKGGYMTPFQDTRIHRPVMSGIFRFRPKEHKMKVESFYDLIGDQKYLISSGVIHTMAGYNEAVDFTNYIKTSRMFNHKPADIEIWECVIPRGTRYMEGHDCNGYSCFGCRSIKFKKKIL